jgi:hypothetical protein
MNNKPFFKTLFILVGFVLIILLAINLIVTAQDSGEVLSETALTGETNREAVPGGPGFISIHPHGFRGRYHNNEWVYTASSEMYNPSTTTALNMVAGVDLPDGAVVNKLVLYYYDNSASDLYAALYRAPLSGGTNQLMAMIDSSGTPLYSHTEVTTIYYDTIDNMSYSYYVTMNFPVSTSANLRFTGFRIDYGYPSYLPSIMN